MKGNSLEKEEKAQFLLNLAKELILSGKYPVPKRGLVISGRFPLPLIETTKESLEERQKMFLSGLMELVHTLDRLYKDVSDDSSG